MSLDLLQRLTELGAKVAESTLSWALHHGPDGPFLQKSASPADEFEQAFFQLAYGKLQEKLHNLLPFLVGFEIVTKEDDNTRAEGVFGFKADNGQILLVPAFFMNGKIKELDMFYSKNNGQFYPLTEDFCELFLKDDATGVGSVSSMSKQDLHKFNPQTDMRDLVYPPRTGRVATASVLLDFLTDSSGPVKQAVLSLLDTQPGLAEAFTTFYPLEKLAAALTLEPQKPSPISLFLPEALGKQSSDLTEVEITSLLSSGYLLRDKRAAESRSRYGSLDVKAQYTNPGESGFYDYVTVAGQLNSGLVLTKLLCLNGAFSSALTLVCDLGSGQSYRVYDRVFVRLKHELKPAGQIRDALIPPSEAVPSPSVSYVLLDDELRASEPFELLENFKDAQGNRRMRVRILRPAFGGSTSGSPPSGFNRTDKASTLDHTLVFTKKPGGSLVCREGGVYVPKSFRLLPVLLSWRSARPSRFSAGDHRAAIKGSREKEALYERNRPGVLGNLLAFYDISGVHPLSLAKHGEEISLKVGRASRSYSGHKAAVIGLVLDCGLGEKSAQDLLSELKEGALLQGWVKLAYTGDYAVPLAEEAPWTNELGQPTFSGEPFVQSAPPDEVYQGDPMALGLGVKDDAASYGGDSQPKKPGGGINAEIAQAVQLARSGQKEIFDTKVLATISKYVDPSSKVVEYIPNFVETLDKLGRMLFLVNWHTEKFQKMYGKDEMPELIELVKNVFKNLGELIIFLKRKFPEISINGNSQAEQ